ncbi:MAG: flagellin FliC [Magnetococcales bacterium]|nr:flagellin FliC [Magnetococcales bacterium]MBF0322540.1 flagellin FliC [Magnetococcales bacterium]
MSISLLTNIASLNSQRNLSKSTGQLSKTYERLSSGLRVNRAADDAAGIGIGSRLSAEVRGMNMAVRNTNDGISMLQVAEGALDETTNAMQRMRELAVQASNGVLTSTDRDSLNTEFLQLMSEVDRIAVYTKFNNTTLLLGSVAAMQIQVGQYSGMILSITINCAKAASIIGTGSLGGTGSAAYSAITQLDYAITSIATIRATIGALQNRFDSVIASLQNTSQNTAAANSRIMDADIAAETATLTKNSILQQAGASILAQANQQPQIALTLLGGR